VLAQHKGHFVVSVFDFRACTHARVHTRLFLLRWCQACTTSILKYTHTDAAIAGVGVQLPCSPALAFFTSGQFHIGHHPQLVRIARNSPVPQKWYKPIIYLHLTRRCTVGRSWLRTLPAMLGSSALRSSELRSAVRVSRGCQGSSWVSGLLVGVRWRRCSLPEATSPQRPWLPLPPPALPPPRARAPCSSHCIAPPPRSPCLASRCWRGAAPSRTSQVRTPHACSLDSARGPACYQALAVVHQGMPVWCLLLCSAHTPCC